MTYTAESTLRHHEYAGDGPTRSRRSASACSAPGRLGVFILGITPELEGAQVRFLDGIHYTNSFGDAVGIMHSKIVLVDGSGRVHRIEQLLEHTR